jgi:hypothetical protein
MFILNNLYFMAKSLPRQEVHLLKVWQSIQVNFVFIWNKGDCCRFMEPDASEQIKI